MGFKNIDLATVQNIGSDPAEIRLALIDLYQDFIAHNHNDTVSSALGSITADYVRASISIESPVINGGTITGTTLVGGEVFVPDSTTPLFSVSSTGEVIAKSITILQQFTAGENLTKGTAGSFRYKVNCTWGDFLLADRDTTAILSAFVYVDEDNPDTNTQSGSATPNSLPKLGLTDLPTANSYYLYGKIDLTSNPPGLPAWYEVEDVRLRIYVVFTASAGTSFSSTLSRVTAAFDPTTITWNNKPADDALNWGGLNTGTTVLGETMASTNDLTTSGYLEMDITRLYRLWSLGTYTNHGFVIKVTGNAGNDSAQIGGINRGGGDAFDQEPYIKLNPTKNNPGSGNIITVSDGRIYNTDSTDYNTISKMVGVVGETVTSGNTVDMYILTNGLFIPSSVIDTSGNDGRTYYLLSADGSIGTYSTDTPNGNYNRKIGIGMGDGIYIEKDVRPILIKTESYWNDLPLLPPSKAKIAEIDFSTNISARNGGKISIIKGETSYSYHDYSTGGSSGAKFTFTWAEGTSGKLTITCVDGGGTPVVFVASVSWYE